MAKRKRLSTTKVDAPNLDQAHSLPFSTIEGETTVGQQKRQMLLPKENCIAPKKDITIQIIVGTYEKILHGVTATISTEALLKNKDNSNADFAETFLFNAHGSAIRCLAISPPSLSSDATNSQKAILASGSSDQSINLYHISTSPAQKLGGPSLAASLAGKTTLENPRNRELGSLQHHSSSINALYFPTRSKLLSAAEDNTVAITRTRDWTVLSTIKPPNPKPYGRPSGDTAPFGGTPIGVNDLAIHPSMKLMVTVGKGEKCMRLWNLVTGKKAGVLNFGKEVLQSVGEGKWGVGEGRKVRWNSLGEEFVVSFERGAVVFGMVNMSVASQHYKKTNLWLKDSKPKCKILPSPSTKIHQLHYLILPKDSGEVSELLAVSTEEGQILFFDTNPGSSIKTAEQTQEHTAPTIHAIGGLGGLKDGVVGRIKDFEILTLPVNGESMECLVVAAGSSDGTIRLWTLNATQLATEVKALRGDSDFNKSSQGLMPEVPSGRQIGRLIGTYETGNRITCLKAFVMSNIMEREASSISVVNRKSAADHGLDLNGSKSDS